MHLLYSRQQTKNKFFDIHYGKDFREDQRHSQEILDLIWAGFNPDPILRPRIDDFLCCPWMSEDDSAANSLLIDSEIEKVMSLEKNPSYK